MLSRRRARNDIGLWTKAHPSSWWILVVKNPQSDHSASQPQRIGILFWKNCFTGFFA
jgi:hypothetical protein